MDKNSIVRRGITPELSEAQRKQAQDADASAEVLREHPQTDVSDAAEEALRKRSQKRK